MTIDLPVDAETVEVVLVGASEMSWTLPVISTEAGVERPWDVQSSNDIDIMFAQAFLTAWAGSHNEAQGQLDTIQHEAMCYPKVRARHATYSGMVQWWQGRFYDAASSLREGVLFALELGDQGLLEEALPLYAAVLAELGFVDAAAVWGRHALALDAADPQLFDCAERAKLHSTVGWVGFMQIVQGDEPLTDVRDLLEQSLRVVRAESCLQPDIVPGISLTLALLDLHHDDPAAALERLDAFDHQLATSDEQMRLMDARVQALIALERWDAAADALGRLGGAVARNKTAEAHWRYALRTGEFLAQRGDLEAAVEQYREAEDVAQELMELAAIGVGRETAAVLHAQSTESLVSLLLELERPEEAFCAAREAQARRIHAVGTPLGDSARAEVARVSAEYVEERRRLDEAIARADTSSGREEERLLALLERNEQRLATLANQLMRERSTWWPSCDDLVPREAGELLLGLYPMGDGWITFVQDERGVEARRIARQPRHELLTDPRLGQELLGPLDAQLEDARFVRVVAGGSAQDIDVHLLEWEGKRLIERRPVVYGAELPLLHGPRATREPRRALLVADPTDTLRAAWGEVTTVSEALHGLGWDVGHGPLQHEADRERMRRELAGSDLFYYAGHAEHEDDRPQGLPLPPYAGGTRASPARLKLASETLLEIQDILTLTSVPRHVVLNGCQTGVPSGVGQGMSLALAFLVAGAEEVVATLDAERDELGLAMGEGLAFELASSGSGLADALQRAQAKRLGRGEPVGRYRVWVR